MSKADEALADVRRWLCENLSDGDAGKVCGMLSVVSRNISELEAENSMLRELENIRMTQVEHCESLTEDIEKLKEENANLRELLLEAYDTARGLALNDPLADVSWLADRMRELGVEAE